MTSEGSSAARHALAAAILAVLAASPCAQAQDADASAQQEPYRDRIIASSQLQALPPDEDADEDDADGQPRGFHVEAIASRTERGDDSYDEQGISIGGFRETANWGTFSL
jgi:hypothetical protein